MVCCAWLRDGREGECQEGGQGRVVIIHLTSKDNVYEDIQMTPFELEEGEGKRRGLQTPPRSHREEQTDER